MSLYVKIKTMDEATMFQILTASDSIRAAMEALGANPGDARIRRIVIDAASKHNISFARTRRKYSQEELQRAIRNSSCFSDVLKHLNLQPHGGNITTIKQIIVESGIDISHFDVTSSRQRNKKQWKFEEIFCKDSEHPRPLLAKAVRRFNLLKEECECGISNTWNGKPITLQVDHKNGINTDNRPGNLRYLCPNCHSQTETFGRKNK
jgi:hypothetical protein